MLYVYLKTYLPDELLRASDAMSMMHSLELRTPFLDYRLVERAMRIPARHKMAWKTGKLLLRDVGEHVLPTRLSAQKMGFSLPLAQWLRGDLQESVRDVLASTAVAQRGIFDPAAVDRMVKDCVAGDDRLVQPVMMLYCFESWARRWLDEAGSAKNGQLPSAITLNDSREAPSTDLSVVVVNWNTRERLHACLASLESHLSGVDHEVIVVDNASSDGSPDMVEERFPSVRLIRNEDNVGFGRANNQAMRVADGKWFLLLNSDTELFDDSVAALFTSIQHEQDIGVAHCSLQFSDGRQQHSTYRFPSLKLALLEDLGLYKFMSDKRAGEALLSGYWEYDEERDVDWVAGAFMLMPRAVFEATNGFDERLFMYGEDLEWCQRIREHGWRIRFFPQASVTHYDHTSSDIRWGDERIAICLMRQRDIYQERNGLARTSALMGIRIIGAALRTAYYTVRSHVGPRTGAYRDMRKFTSRSLAALLPLLLRR
jgi:GT2 family glycosyltransferase